MAAYIKDILDKNNDIIYPTTKVKAIFDDAGKTLDSLLTEKANANDVYTKKQIDELMKVDDVISKESLVSIVVTSKPLKTAYTNGQALSLSGLLVTAIYGSGDTKDVSSLITSNPADGSTLSTTGTSIINISYTEGGITKTTSFNIKVYDPVNIVSWADGTDAEIVAMVEAADRGEINLTDYWAVGQERQVSLSAMEATGVGETHVAQTVTLVLMNSGGKTLATATEGGRIECSFIVGLKSGLSNGTTGEFGYMNSGNTNVGGWDSCARRTWCNSVFRDAIPASIRDIFKQHLNITADGSSTTTVTSTDYFALPAEKEVFGTNTYGSSVAEASLAQFTYYATVSNRIKSRGDSGSAYNWWNRSPRLDSSTQFCAVYSDGGAYNYTANSAYMIAPFGCI